MVKAPVVGNKLRGKSEQFDLSGPHRVSSHEKGKHPPILPALHARPKRCGRVDERLEYACFYPLQGVDYSKAGIFLLQDPVCGSRQPYGT
jgi:hypothetical protein